MTVDVRCNIACSLGTVISGNVGDDLLTEPGLVRTTGTIVVEGLQLPAKGTPVELAYHRPQTGQITRFPRRLRVLRATADPYRNLTTVEVGCLLALRYDVSDRRAIYPVTAVNTSALVTSAEANQTGEGSVLESYQQVYTRINAQLLLAHCCQKVGISLASGNHALQGAFLRPSIDLSGGYLAVANDLLKSECCWGVLNLSEQLVVGKINLGAGVTAGVLGDGDLIDLQPISGGQEPADEVTVDWALYGR